MLEPKVEVEEEVKPRRDGHLTIDPLHLLSWVALEDERRSQLRLERRRDRFPDVDVEPQRAPEVSQPTNDVVPLWIVLLEDEACVLKDDKDVGVVLLSLRTKFFEL